MIDEAQPHRDIPAYIRRVVEIEAAFRCAICKGTSSLELHHIVPHAKGGKDSTKNLILLCATCHGRADKGEISREDLRALKKTLYQKDEIASLDKDALRGLLAELFTEVLEKLQPTFERLRSVASHKQSTVPRLIEETFGTDKSRLIMQALYEGNDELAIKLFSEWIEAEEPIRTIQAKIKLPIYLNMLRFREAGTKMDFKKLLSLTNQVRIRCGSLGGLSLSKIVVLSDEVPDLYVGLPFIRIAVLGRVSLPISDETSAEVLEHFTHLGIAWESSISDVDYDYIYFHKFTASGKAFQSWLEDYYTNQ